MTGETNSGSNSCGTEYEGKVRELWEKCAKMKGTQLLPLLLLNKEIF